MLVLLELKSQVITNPDIKKDDMSKIFGINENDIDSIILEYYQKIIPEALGGGNLFTEKELQYYKENDSSFYRQIFYVNAKFSLIKSDNDLDYNLNFKDGSKTTIPDDINRDAIAIRKILGELANSKKQYEYWLSFEDGSFYDLYSRWFGFPMRLLEDTPHEMDL